ncbi:XRE family transcriptional regulator [Hymenobacter sp. UV11]|uniref:helix-turn-helix domain-containing protein n=1 Tax=Hymenobacter sp. UV11 TaxID=1849735 RepID=UPI00105CE14C|nr:helix-turn-helix transcriptional regulator [Hymenobacter sp. UV11]TDN39418.1 hypothetical protein A8B98_19450 [Hymenobacter sp. UV11]TFZ65494.1 XRE family transcriptional regulator [Hymenobacter sp. UV11]
MPTPASIGQRFTQLIQHLGLSKNAFAQSLDKTATVIQHLVDERNKPGYDLLCKVFETYPNVSKDWLLLGNGPMLVEEAEASSSTPPTPAAAPLPAAGLTAAADLLAAPVTPPTEVLIAAASVEPVAPALTPPVAPAPPVSAAPAPAAALPPVPAATPPAPAAVPDPAYLTAALQTQYLQHQLALAEQRNQHLVEQQSLMQQLVAVLQRAS